MPSSRSCDHVPPYADILDRFDPTGVFQFARLVEVEDQSAGQCLACVVGDHHSAPRRLAGCLKVSFVALSIGCEPRLESVGFLYVVEVHAGVIYQRSLVDVDVESIGSLHLQGSLNTSIGEGGGTGVAGMRLDYARHQLADLTETRLCITVFLGVVITWNPPSHIVGGHGKLSLFFLHHEIDQLLLLWKLISESESIVVETETQHHRPFGSGLLECHRHLVVVVADGGLLAPNGLPCLVECGMLATGLGESCHEVVATHQL